jgi:CPA1 family monovalent cation:H+ antiporter
MTMELTVIAIVGIVVLIGVAAISARLAVATPLSLVVVGIGLSFLPGLPTITVRPNTILAGALPPLLYATAVRMPVVDFRRDFKAIAGLAVPLVVITTVGTGFLFHVLLPGFGLAYSFALGAIISPTDAVAATSVGRRLGLPSRLMTILEGEGLVNDASSLVLLGAAISATTGTVHLWKVGADFVVSVVVATAIGMVIGYVNVRLRPLLGDSVLSTAASFAVPFLAWVPAQALGESGVLAAVVAGLVTGHLSPRYLPAQDRLAETENWQTLGFLLENGIFLLMGLQLKTLVNAADTGGISVAEAVWIGLAACGAAVVLRMAFTAPLVAALRHDARQAAASRPQLEQMQSKVADPDDPDLGGRRFSSRRLERLMLRITRRLGDIDFFEAENFGWRGGVVLAWSGMRGVVTVAAAETLPEDTPLRPQVILIAFVVAGTTLLAQGLSLPWVIRSLRIPGDDPAADRSEYGRLVGELSAKAAEALEDPGLTLPDGSRYDDDVLTRVHDAVKSRITFTEPDDEGRSINPRDQYRELMLAVIAAERVGLLAARDEGRYSSRTLGRAQRALDVMEANLTQIPGLTSQ